MASMKERAIKGRVGRGRARRRPASMARSTATHPKARVGRGRRPSRRRARAAKRARKIKSARPRAKPRGEPKVGKIRSR